MTVDDSAALEAAADESAPSTVLVVDDEPGLVELYTAWLATEYTVRTASDGPDALEVVDAFVDVILLDRRMPGMDGDTVLTEFRDRGIDAMVAMVTAVEPEADIIDLPFDEYVIKPMSRESVIRTVEQLVQRRQYSVQARRCFELASKLSVLESTHRGTISEEPEAIQSLRDRLTEALAAADESIRQLIESGAIEGAVIDLER